MLSPLGVRMISLTSPGFMPGTISATTDGSWFALRQPSLPPSSAVPASE